jgi:hypothetical protein
MSITLDDVLRFLRAQTNGDTCPSCGTNRWGIDGYGKDGNTYAIPTNALPSTQKSPVLHYPAPSLPVVMLVCDHCGLVRMHRYEHIRRWSELHPES